jgi:hypothetical protein
MPSRGSIKRAAELHKATIEAERAFCQHIGGEIIRAMASIRVHESERPDEPAALAGIKLQTALGDWFITVGRPPAPEETTI